MQTRRLWGDVLIALCASPLLVACASNPSTDEDSAARVCPPKSTTATLPGTGGPGGAAALTPVTSFGANPAGLKMYVHAPASGKATAVVVAMHGCTQTASAYVAAGWNEVADAAGFVVVYPEQTSQNNSSQCFRWWDSANITRGKGEARSIAAMVEYAKTTFGATHAYATGLSAGAAMTSVMLATYPDLFEAGAIMAGLPYGCAATQNDAYSCMSGKDKTPAAWGALVPKVPGAAVPRVAIWHGDADFTVRPTNLDQLVKQWTDVNGISDKPTASNTVGKAKHDEFRAPGGGVRVESWRIAGMAHGVSVDPTAGCGKAGAYVIDEGLCSTRKAAEFFGLIAPDAAPPGSTSGGTTPGGSAPGKPGSGGGANGGTGSTPGDCDP
jgi:poly(hydroxyalkanoate) depolymerase family esterase